MTRRARDPAAAIVAQLAPMIDGARDVETRETPWASATFAGTRYTIGLTVDRSTDVERLAATIGDIEFELRRRFVADITVIEALPAGDSIRLVLEALVIDEA